MMILEQRACGGTAGGWGAGGAPTQVAGGVLTDIEPLAAIAAHSRAPAVVDAFAVSDAGALLLTTLDQATGQWSALSPSAVNRCAWPAWPPPARRAPLTSRW